MRISFFLRTTQRVDLQDQSDEFCGIMKRATAMSVVLELDPKHTVLGLKLFGVRGAQHNQG